MILADSAQSWRAMSPRLRFCTYLAALGIPLWSSSCQIVSPPIAQVVAPVVEVVDGQVVGGRIEGDIRMHIRPRSSSPASVAETCDRYLLNVTGNSVRCSDCDYAFNVEVSGASPAELTGVPDRVSLCDLPSSVSGPIKIRHLYGKGAVYFKEQFWGYILPSTEYQSYRTGFEFRSSWFPSHDDLVEYQYEGLIMANFPMVMP